MATNVKLAVIYYSSTGTVHGMAVRLAQAAEKAGALKIVATASGRDVVVTGPLTQKVGGAIVANVGGNRIESASTSFTEVAGGAHVVKAANVTYEATAALTVVMGASTLTLLPDVVLVAGVSIKLDGVVKDGGVLVVDN